MDDVPTWKRRSKRRSTASFANMGEVCNAGSRLLVDRSIHDAFVEQFIAVGQRRLQSRAIHSTPTTNMGPLVTVRGATEARSRLHRGRQAGGCSSSSSVAAHPDGLEAGHLRQPDSVHRGRATDMRIAREEIFGPVASVIPVDGVEEAVAVANDTVYGLAAGVWTSNLNTAHRN